MKNLNKKLENYKIGSASMFAIGGIIMGIGGYNSKENNISETNLIVGFGAIISVFGGAYYLGREDQKNYQTKPEDYQINK